MQHRNDLNKNTSISICVRMCYFFFTPSWIVLSFDIGCYVIHWRAQLLHMDLGLDRTVSSQGSWSHDSITRIDLSPNWPCAGASLWGIWVLVYSVLLWIVKWSVVFCLPQHEGGEFYLRQWVGTPRPRGLLLQWCTMQNNMSLLG